MRYSTTPTRVRQRGWNRAVSVCLMGLASIYLPVWCQAQAPLGYTITTLAGNGSAGFSGDAAAAVNAQLNQPLGVAVDASGNLHIADQINCRIRKVTPDGTISTLAGNGSIGYAGDGATATSAQLNNPAGVAVDSAGNVYIADYGNNRIRKVASGTITTAAGSVTGGYAGDGGAATSAQIQQPSGVAVDAGGNFYFADAGNNRIRMVAAAKTAIITTVASQLSAPRGVAVDAAGNLYIADTNSHRIRKVANGVMTAVAGNGVGGYAGDGGPATSAQLNFPRGVAVDAAGNLYIADTQNSVIRLLTPIPQPVPAISSGGVVSAGAFGAFTSVAPGSWMEIYGSALAANSRGWVAGDFNGVNAPTSLDGTKVTIGGQAAFIDYISPGQVNAQVPSNVATGPQQITVTTAGGTSAPYTVVVNSTQPGLLAPPLFNIGGTQYVAAVFPDNVTFVLPPGAIPGVASRQAKPGETIIIYGVGFGPVIPDIPAGRIVHESNTLATVPFQISFGPAAVTPSYAGLAQTYAGLYQFNVVVPSVAKSDAVPLTFTLGGVSGTQTLYTAVGN